MHTSPEDLLNLLDDLGIAQTTHDHPAVFTVEEAREHCSSIPGAHAKNLFFKDKKNRFFLVITLADKPIRIKDTARAIGAKNIYFARPEHLKKILGVVPGAVTPFAAVNIQDHGVSIVLDEEMMAHDLLNFHPLVNTATTSISSRDLVRFLEHCGVPPEIIRL